MIEYMFRVPFLRLRCVKWKEKKEEIKRRITISESEVLLNVTTNYNLDYNKNFFNLSYVFAEEILHFKKSFNFKNVYPTNFWFEKSLKNNYHSVHNHGATGFSAICFVEYNKNHTPTNFIAPFNNFATGLTMFYRPKDIEEGDVIFFPSVINHWTDPNVSDVERLIVSFNMEVELNN